jgi:hypothetical protein
MKALELAGIEFLEGEHGRRRSEGVRFLADRTAKLREELTENVSRHFGYALKYLVDEDQEVFQRSNEEIVELIMGKLQEEVKSELHKTLNKRNIDLAQ